MRSTPDLYLTHDLRDAIEIVRVALVVDDVQVEHVAATTADMTVAEIPAEQLGVRRPVELYAVTTRTRHIGMRLASGEPSPLVETSPTPDRLDGNPVQGSVVDVAHARIGGAESALDGLDGANVRHKDMFMRSTDSACRVWDSNPQVLSDSGV
jgi:hypothetical protein